MMVEMMEPRAGLDPQRWSQVTVPAAAAHQGAGPGRAFPLQVVRHLSAASNLVPSVHLLVGDSDPPTGHWGIGGAQTWIWSRPPALTPS